ncbi:MAG: phosphomannose isomerase type II C-terminal cupin domain [Geminicoccaceae bacterium]|nr:phosphomannose isomerase type II C-terminal cupin domain [Geminicoccaceae bacterium]
MGEVTYRTGDSDERPWGRWRVLDVDRGFVVKRITVDPGGILSLQFHRYRAEHWFILRGRARVTLGEREFELRAGEAVDVPVGTPHRVANPGEETLEFVEVQHGERLDEADIVRLDDRYGRL